MACWEESRVLALVEASPVFAAVLAATVGGGSRQLVAAATSAAVRSVGRTAEVEAIEASEVLRQKLVAVGTELQFRELASRAAGREFTHAAPAKQWLSSVDGEAADVFGAVVAKRNGAVHGAAAGRRAGRHRHGRAQPGSSGTESTGCGSVHGEAVPTADASVQCGGLATAEAAVQAVLGGYEDKAERARKAAGGAAARAPKASVKGGAVAPTGAPAAACRPGATQGKLPVGSSCVDGSYDCPPSDSEDSTVEELEAVLAARAELQAIRERRQLGLGGSRRPACCAERPLHGARPAPG